MVSNSVKPSGNYVVLDLTPATWYQLRVTAHNNVGFTQAEFEFATLTIMGSMCAFLFLHPTISIKAFLIYYFAFSCFS